MTILVIVFLFQEKEALLCELRLKKWENRIVGCVMLPRSAYFCYSYSLRLPRQCAGNVGQEAKASNENKANKIVFPRQTHTHTALISHLGINEKKLWNEKQKWTNSSFHSHHNCSQSV